VIAAAGIVHVAASALAHRTRSRPRGTTSVGSTVAAKRKLAALVVGLVKLAAWAARCGW